MTLPAKVCTKCKTLTDNFSPSSKYHCRKCNRERVAEWRKSNPEKYNEQLKRRNKDAMRANNSRWAKNNPQYTRAANINRRARYYAADGRITSTTMAELITLYGDMCLACGSVDNLQIDHVVPLAKGGSNLIENLQLLCAPCNISKSATTIDFRIDTSG